MTTARLRLTRDLIRVIAWSEQGFVVGIRRRGTVADGGLLLAGALARRVRQIGEEDPP